ncbi:hypothetical protein MAN_02698, partial [Metarhizium hybridum]
MPPSGLVRCESWVGITEQEFMKWERLLVVWLVALVPSQCQNVLKTDGRALLPRRLVGRPDVCNPAVHHRAFRPPPRVQYADGLGRELLRRVSKASSSSTTYTTLGSTRPSLRPARGPARNIISQPHYAAIPAPDWTIGSSPGHLARGASRINPTLAHADRGCHQPSPQERRLRPLTSAFVFSRLCNRSNVPIRGPCKHPSQAEPLKLGWDAWLLQDKSHLQYLALVVSV